jgi:hypothetical protein
VRCNYQIQLQALQQLYAPAFTNNYYAGKNKIINGDFSVWQRGTSSFSAPGYTADRWRYSAGNGGIGVTQQSFTPGAAPVSGYEGKFFLRYAAAVASTSGTPTLEQRIEDVQTYAGQTVTVSFWAKSSASTLPSSIVLTQNFGSGGSTAVDTTVVSSPSYTTSWVRYSYTVAVPSISGKTVGTSSYLSLVFNFPLNQTWISFDIWGVQVEAGSVATPFQTATGTIQGELAACQRYYWRTATANTGVSASGGSLAVVYFFPVQLRTSATVTHNLTNANYTTNWTLDVAYVTGNVAKTGTVGFNVNNNSPTNAALYLTGATWASTPNIFYPLGSGYIEASAEL